MSQADEILKAQDIGFGKCFSTVRKQIESTIAEIAKSSDFEALIACEECGYSGKNFSSARIEELKKLLDWVIENETD